MNLMATVFVFAVVIYFQVSVYAYRCHEFNGASCLDLCIWSLKEWKKRFSVKWEIIGKWMSYSKWTLDLCLYEKFIMLSPKLRLEPKERTTRTLHGKHGWHMRLSCCLSPIVKPDRTLFSDLDYVSRVGSWSLPCFEVFFLGTPVVPPHQNQHLSGRGRPLIMGYGPRATA